MSFIFVIVLHVVYVSSALRQPSKWRLNLPKLIADRSSALVTLTKQPTSVV